MPSRDFPHAEGLWTDGLLGGMVVLRAGKREDGRHCSAEYDQMHSENAGYKLGWDRGLALVGVNGGNAEGEGAL